MKVLVTGASGFIGRQVVHLLADNPDIRLIAVDTELRDIVPTPHLQVVTGDLTDPEVLAAAAGGSLDAVIHLAAIPGGAAEANPELSQRVNIEATLNLLTTVARTGNRPRFVFASTIAVLGEPLPKNGVDDATPLAPRLIYGAHKAMIETMLATLHRRGAVVGVACRLPGIVARPKGSSGMKSAFMSNLFHALREHRSFVSPISRNATMWLMSVEQVARSLLHALYLEDPLLPREPAFTLPALCVRWSDLADEVVAQTGAPEDAVSYAPDAALEAGFGAYPPLATPAADRAGFAHDGDVATLVHRALKHMGAT